MSTYIIGLFDKYVEETSKLQSHSNNTHEAQMKSIEDFQMAYEVSHLALFSFAAKFGRCVSNTIFLCRSNQNQRSRSF